MRAIYVIINVYDDFNLESENISLVKDNGIDLYVIPMSENEVENALSLTNHLRLNGFKVDMDGFNKCFEMHQEKSRQDVAGTFKGGLADHSEVTTAYHTATHLLLESLQRILGNHVMQKGSNITAERIRFDFSNPEKVTRDILDKVEEINYYE